MTPTAFKSWRHRLGLTQEEAGELLGRTRRMIILYENGQPHRGRSNAVPQSIEITCGLLEEGRTGALPI